VSKNKINLNTKSSKGEALSSFFLYLKAPALRIIIEILNTEKRVLL